MNDQPSTEIVQDQRSDRLLPLEIEPAERSGIHQLLRKQAFWFGPFQLLPAQQLLLRHGTPVRIGSRALEILMALVERPGLLVTKSELMARVWPATFVDESNLKVQICGVRRALGDGHNGGRFLATVAGRGYRFVAPVAVEAVDTGDIKIDRQPAKSLADDYDRRAVRALHADAAKAFARLAANAESEASFEGSGA